MKIFRNTLITLSAVIFVISSCSQSEDVSETPIIEEIKMVQAIIKTSVGEIHLELDREKAPVTVDNFVAIAESGYYTDTIFHRVINGFMIQGGGLTADMGNKSSNTQPITNEIGRAHV